MSPDPLSLICVSWDFMTYAHEIRARFHAKLLEEGFLQHGMPLQPLYGNPVANLPRSSL